MRRFPVLMAVLLLTACNGGVSPIDARKFLEGLDGPKVPSMQDSLADSARNAEKRGDFAQAAALWQQVLEKSPGNDEASLSMAESLRRSGNLDQSLTVYEA